MRQGTKKKWNNKRVQTWNNINITNRVSWKEYGNYRGSATEVYILFWAFNQQLIFSYFESENLSYASNDDKKYSKPKRLLWDMNPQSTGQTVRNYIHHTKHTVNERHRKTFSNLYHAWLVLVEFNQFIWTRLFHWPISYSEEITSQSKTTFCKNNWK